jgi:hypothetical protein
MKLKKIIEITDKEKEQHLDLLMDAFFDNLEYDGSCEFGSLGLDCKRPFGNSSVEIDILEIIGLIDNYDGFYNLDDDAQRDYKSYARDLYCNELISHIQKTWAKLQGR